MSHPVHTLSIIIPAYNEEKTIEAILEKIQGVDLSILSVTKEIIIVDDGSKDGTISRIERFKEKYPDTSLTLIQKENGGKGSAIRTAIPHCTGTITIIQDADLEYDPQDYGALIEPIISGTVDAVYGLRRLNKVNVQYSGLSFYLGGMVLTVLANVLYNIRLTDEPTCYKVFKTTLLKDIPLTCTRFEFCPEITAKVAKRKIKIHEVPISYYPRSVAEGKKINWRDGVEGIWTLIKHRIID